MCGRYYVDDDTAKEIRKLLEHLDARFERGKQANTISSALQAEGNKAREGLIRQVASMKGEIRPTNTVPILLKDKSEDRVGITMSKWGFSSFTGKGVLINAKAETAIEKKTFRESVLSRRCIIPAAGFYEWDSAKNKIYFTVPKKKCMYMAGLYRYEQEENRFVVLTTAANSSMEKVHDRMPLIVDEETIPDWIMDDQATNEILHRVPTNLDSSAEYYQNSLMDFLK